MRLALGTFARAIALGVVSSRLARAIGTRSPLAVADDPSAASISVVIPARNEADRIRPLLEMIVGAPGVGEVIVVDDQSTDSTADIARPSWCSDRRCG